MGTIYSPPSLCLSLSLSPIPRPSNSLVIFLKNDMPGRSQQVVEGGVVCEAG